MIFRDEKHSREHSQALSRWLRWKQRNPEKVREYDRLKKMRKRLKNPNYERDVYRRRRQKKKMLFDALVLSLAAPIEI